MFRREAAKNGTESRVYRMFLMGGTFHADLGLEELCALIFGQFQQ